VRSRDNVRVVRAGQRRTRDGLVSIDGAIVEMLCQWRYQCVETALLRYQSQELGLLVPVSARPLDARWPEGVNYAFSKICSRLVIRGI
jgi:hypothetical protein